MRAVAVALLLSACGPAAFHHVRRAAPPVASEAEPSVAARATEDLDGRFWTERVAAHVGAGELTLALATCDAAPVRGAELDTVCGLAALRSGDQHAAHERWEAAARAGSVPAMHELALLAIAQHDAETALRITEAWVAATPREYEAWRLRGRALRLANDFDAARAALELALALDPERPDAYYELGVLWMSYVDDGDEGRRRAIEHFDQFVARASGRPEHAAALDAITARCGLVRLGDARSRARARRALRRGDCPSSGYLERMRAMEPIVTLRDIEEMQRMAAEMERANAAAAAALEAEAAAHAGETERRE